MARIFVLNETPFETGITVQRKYHDGSEEIVEWCNHANAELIVEEREFQRLEHTDIFYEVNIIKCKDCEAWRETWESEWSDTPIEGEHK